MRDTESIVFTSGLVLLISFVVVSGCFITNCPPGGKRSGMDSKIRQCESCGPPGMKGRCYGPQICCSPEFGCLMGTSETVNCLHENLHTTLCHNPGDSCGGNDDNNLINGQCAMNGVCCSTDTCTLDEKCQQQNDQGPFSKGTLSMANLNVQGNSEDDYGQQGPLPMLRPLPSRFNSLPMFSSKLVRFSSNGNVGHPHHLHPHHNNQPHAGTIVLRKPFRPIVSQAEPEVQLPQTPPSSTILQRIPSFSDSSIKSMNYGNGGGGEGSSGNEEY